MGIETARYFSFFGGVKAPEEIPAPLKGIWDRFVEASKERYYALLDEEWPADYAGWQADEDALASVVRPAAEKTEYLGADGSVRAWAYIFGPFAVLEVDCSAANWKEVGVVN